MSVKSKVLDLRHVHLGTSKVFAAPLKSQASHVAKTLGWPAQNVRPAGNRFSVFWVIGQGIGSDTFRLLKRDGSWLDIPHPGVF